MEYDHSALGAAMIRRLPKAPLTAKGQIRLPAVPALLDEHVERLTTLWSSIGRPFNQTDRAKLRDLLSKKLEEGFAKSAYAGVMINYETLELPKTGLSYRLSLVVSSMADEYAGWVTTRTPPLFGSHPDAKVMDLARGLGAPSETPVLDIGAGTGRNTLPLARAGHPTHAVEMSPALAQILEKSIESEGLGVEVFAGNVLSDELALPRGHYRLIVAPEVVFHLRSLDEVRAFVRRGAELLAPGGLFLFDMFLAEEGYEPDPIARELSQAQWTTLYTRADLASAVLGLELEAVSDESVHGYEQEHLAPEAWPPNGWFEGWVQGTDLFDLPEDESPIDMRWLVFRRPLA